MPSNIRSEYFSCLNINCVPTYIFRRWCSDGTRSFSPGQFSDDSAGLAFSTACMSTNLLRTPKHIYTLLVNKDLCAPPYLGILSRGLENIPELTQKAHTCVYFVHRGA